MLPLYEKTGNFAEVHDQISRHFPPHLHHSIEMVYVTEGTLAIGVGQELFPMEKGDFAVVFPDLIHHYQVFSGGDNTACHIIASPALGGAYQEELASLCPKDPVIPGDKLHPDIPYAVRRLREIDQASDAIKKDSQLLMTAYIEILLARSMPQFTLVEKESVGSDDIIYRTVSYISGHFREEISLTSMAHDLGVSQFALSRVFSGTFHRNFNQYLNETRLDYATSLLRYTGQSITEAAMNAGFESQRTFNRVFRERYHMSPREWRKL